MSLRNATINYKKTDTYVFLCVFLLTIEAQKKGLDKNCQALFGLCFEYLYKRFVLPCTGDPTGSAVKN